jgi:acyl-CoA synthetase (NDP forming)
LVISTTHDGFPVLDGVVPFLKSVRGLMNYRDFRQRPAFTTSPAPPGVVEKWSRTLAEESALDEARSLEMLRDFDIGASKPVAINSEQDLRTAVESFAFPMVLKTAVPGLQHKTEQKGVFLDQENLSQLIDSYRDIVNRLGSAAILAEMAPAGVEMILGARRDPQFGPVVMLGFGGVFAEVLNDVVFAIPPFDANYALQRLQELRVKTLLDGVRGEPASCVAAYCDAAEAFSVMVDALRDDIEEVDVNPLLVSASRCVAVDALVIGRRKERGEKI